MNLKDFKNMSLYKSFYEDVGKIPCNPATDNGDAYWGYITLPLVELDKVLADPDFVVANNPSIIDLGAGYCEMLLYLGYIFDTDNLTAVELNEDYALRAEQLIAQYELPINYSQGDYTTKDISQHDVIYSFCIAKRQPEYAQFNDFVLNNMKVGAIWIEMLAVESRPSDMMNTDSVVRAIDRHPGTFTTLRFGPGIIVKKVADA